MLSTFSYSVTVAIFSRIFRYTLMSREYILSLMFVLKLHFLSINGASFKFCGTSSVNNEVPQTTQKVAPLRVLHVGYFAAQIQLYQAGPCKCSCIKEN